MASGTEIAIGIGVVAVGGGIAYVLLRNRKEPSALCKAQAALTGVSAEQCDGILAGAVDALSGIGRGASAAAGAIPGAVAGIPKGAVQGYGAAVNKLFGGSDGPSCPPGSRPATLFEKTRTGRSCIP